MQRNIDIAIIGGGIAGLTAALSLHAAGFRPIVYEAVAEPAPLGAGINLLPHAVRELSELGLLAELLGIGFEIHDLNYLTAGGEVVWHEFRGSKAGYHWPQIAIHRGEFQMFLLAKVRERLGPNAVRLGHELRSLVMDNAKPRATLVDRHNGKEVAIAPDLLLAADGIHSKVRQHFYPDEGSPRWNGVTLWRSTTPVAAPLGGRAMIWAGTATQKFVAYPIGVDQETGQPRLNWICELKVAEVGSPPPRDWNRLGSPADFLPRFASWRWNGIDVPAIVEAAGQIYEFPMIDRDPLPRWTFGHATLLGDAAHPMYPIGSNGATQGILDARVLAWHLARSDSIAAALSAYESDRREATARIVLMNRQKGPDQVLDLAAERLAGGKGTLDRVLPEAERRAIADRYKQVAGFDPATLNARPSFSISS